METIKQKGGRNDRLSQNLGWFVSLISPFIARREGVAVPVCS